MTELSVWYTISVGSAWGRQTFSESLITDLSCHSTISISGTLSNYASGESQVAEVASITVCIDCACFSHTFEVCGVTGLVSPGTICVNSALFSLALLGSWVAEVDCCVSAVSVSCTGRVGASVSVANLGRCAISVSFAVHWVAYIIDRKANFKSLAFCIWSAGRESSEELRLKISGDLGCLGECESQEDNEKLCFHVIRFINQECWCDLYCRLQVCL